MINLTLGKTLIGMDIIAKAIECDLKGLYINIQQWAPSLDLVLA